MSQISVISVVSLIPLVVTSIFSSSTATATTADSTNTTCGGFQTGTNGTICSPGWPNEYPNSIDCQWKITVKTDQVRGDERDIL